jgi:hypothetical protein
MRCLFITSALAGLSVTSLAVPLFKRDVTGPVFEHDFPDPSIIKVGNTWHAFGTQSIYDSTEIKTPAPTSPPGSSTTATTPSATSPPGSTSLSPKSGPQTSSRSTTARS